MVRKLFRRKPTSVFSAEPLALRAPDGRAVLHFPGPVIDNLRQMLTRLHYKEELPQRLGLLSALSGEGVTYIAQAIGAILANDMSGRVCVVDVNWWQPSTTLPAHSGGLAAAVAGTATLEDVLLDTGQPNLYLLPAGELAAADRPVVARSTALAEVLDELNQTFEHVILDIPAALTTSDAIALAGLAEGLIVVVQQGVTPVESVRLALDNVSHLPVLGVIMNQVETHTPTGILNLVPQV